MNTRRFRIIPLQDVVISGRDGLSQKKYEGTSLKDRELEVIVCDKEWSLKGRLKNEKLFNISIRFGLTKIIKRNGDNYCIDGEGLSGRGLHLSKGKGMNYAFLCELAPLVKVMVGCSPSNFEAGTGGADRVGDQASIVAGGSSMKSAFSGAKSVTVSQPTIKKRPRNDLDWGDGAEGGFDTHLSKIQKVPLGDSNAQEREKRRQMNEKQATRGFAQPSSPGKIISSTKHSNLHGNSKVQLPGTHPLIANQRGGRAPGGVGSLSKAETINKLDPPMRRKTQQKSTSFVMQHSMNSSRKPAESVAQKATAWSNATSGQSSYGGGGTLQSLGRGISKLGSSFGLTQSSTIPGGIRNLGNTCYIGATLQALLAQAPFVNDLLSPAWQGINQTVQHHLACSNKESEDGVSSRLEKALRSPQRSLVVQLRQLAERSQDLARRKSGPQGMLNSIDVTAFKSALDQYTPFFRGFRQNDAQEFFSSLINGIFEESEGQLKWYLHREGASLLTPVEATVGTYTIETVESANTSFDSGRSDEDVNTNVPEIVDLGEDSNDGHTISADSTTPKKIETGVADWHVGPDGGERQERVSEKAESVVSADPASSASTTPAGSTGANTPSTGKRSIAGDTAPQSTATPSDGMLMPDLMYTMIPTVRHFKAGIQFQTFCSKCGHHQSERLEGYSEIPLDLLMDQDRTSKPASGNFFGAIAPKLPTLRVRDLLKHFFKDDRRSFTCEHCDDKSDGNAIYKSRLVKMPQVLVLHLKRFTYDLKNGTLEKNRRALQVPPMLEVAEWDDAARDGGESASSSSGAKSVESARVCSAMATTYDARIDLQKGPKGAIDAASAAIAMAASNHDAEIEGSTSSSSSLPGRYALSGVVRHLGIDCRSGHYVADVPMPQKAGTASTGISLSDKWRRCDDSTVREIPLEKVIADKESPYLLFYRLVGTGSADTVSREA